MEERKEKGGERDGGRDGGVGGGRKEGRNRALMMELPCGGFGKPRVKMGREYWGPAGHLLISRKNQGLTAR